MSFPSSVSVASAANGGNTSEFVNSDVAALALHMERCAQSRGSLFALRRHLQVGRAALAGRLVTVAFVSGTVVALALQFV